MTSAFTSSTPATISAASVHRKNFSIQSEGPSRLYILLADASDAVVSNTNYTVYLEAGDFYEAPINYKGAITGYFTVANSSARVTEIK